MSERKQLRRCLDFIPLRAGFIIGKSWALFMPSFKNKIKTLSSQEDASSLKATFSFKSWLCQMTTTLGERHLVKQQELCFSLSLVDCKYCQLC